MIVMKFGGTSVEDAEAITRLLILVRERLRQQPVVVCSAMATVTDTLLQAASIAAGGNATASLGKIEDLKALHISTARALLTDPNSTEQRLCDLFGQMTSLLVVVGSAGELTNRASDLIASFGERLSSELVSAALEEWGIASTLVDARACIVTDDNFANAAPLITQTSGRLRAKLLPLLQSKRVPVLGGFIAATADGETTTLGRGGSDLTAALVGAALVAERVEIWTDVDGICTTDPRLYPLARPIDSISFEVAVELACRGAKVLHPATLIPAIERNVPVYVLNSRNPRHPGTCVRAESNSDHGVSAIAVKRDITLVEASTARSFRSRGLALEVFNCLETQGCIPDIASISDSSLTMAVDNKEVITALREHFGPRVSITTETNKALVSLVGEDVRRIAGLPARVFAALQGFDLRLASPGACQRSFSFVTGEQDLREVVRALHELLLENSACYSLIPREDAVFL
jgi:aspartate kinase